VTWKTDRERIENNRVAKQKELENQRVLHDLFFKKKPAPPVKKGSK